MFIPAMFFLRMLGQYVGPLAWLAFGGVIAWFLFAIRRAPADDQPQSEGR